MRRRISALCAVSAVMTVGARNVSIKKIQSILTILISGRWVCAVKFVWNTGASHACLVKSIHAVCALAFGVSNVWNLRKCQAIRGAIGVF